MDLTGKLEPEKLLKEIHKIDESIYFNEECMSLLKNLRRKNANIKAKIISFALCKRIITVK